MNRKQRRDFTKDPESVVAACVKAERDRVIKIIVHQYSVSMVMVAYDKLELPRDKLIYFLQEVINMYDSINKDYVRIEDLEQVIKEELDIEID